MASNKQFLIDIGQGISLRIGLPTLATWNKLSRPKNPKSGTFGFNQDTLSLEYWDGENWLAANFKNTK